METRSTVKSGIGSHHSQRAGKDEWLTPPEILYALGEFDLDPCSPINRPWSTAENHYTIEDDGLSLPWEGRVFCNPPYGKNTGIWLRKCSQHKNAIALVFARTETEFFQEVFRDADSILFIAGRLHFYHVSGLRAKMNAGGPSVLISYNSSNTNVLEKCGIRGKLIRLR